VDSRLREAASTSLLEAPDGFSGTERFQLVRQLGQGGFGVVYEAIDRGMSGSPSVALKLLRRPHADRLSRFKREFRALAEVRHPNLVQLYELVAAGPNVFFTMELISGASPLQRADPDQVRELVRQLAEGVHALHLAGKLHRDVKPSNILVQPDGRVVLVDFGLAIELDVAATQDRAGTPLYMSPEQCAGGALDQASDWYAVGAVLFEALTGRTPFRGSIQELVSAKQSQAAPRASQLASGVPEDLDELCAALLSRAPEARPRGDEVLRRLHSVSAPVEPTRREPFVGRAAELAELARRFDDLARGQTTVVLARGPSGIGKSALLRRFLDDVRQRRPETMILSGRCFELESVPYKALDAIVDELAHQLRRLPDVESAALLPRDAKALATLFPVLEQVPTFAQHVRRSDDPGDVRGRGFAALREVLARIGDRRPVLVCVDDLQWGDVDSAALFAELIRSPEAPSVFWLMSFREDEAATSPLLSRLAQLRQTTLADAAIVDLHLGALDNNEAEALAATLLGSGGGRDPRAHAIAVESQGSPFFVCELARAGEGDHALGGLVRQRVAQLEGAARRVLEVVAVAAQPLELEVAGAASDAGAELRDALSTLRSEHLIRAREAPQEEKLLECYHDRIREAVVSSLAPPALAGLHLALAAALEASGSSDAAQIGRHLAEGGDPARAQGYLTEAARRAAAAMAFEEAAQLYRRALELSPRVGDKSDTTSVELAYAEALSAAGHGQEAARLWLGLVDRVDAHKGIDLRRRAAEELLLSGQLEEGYAVIGALLGDLNLSVPRSTAGAIARILASRIRQAFSGRRLRVPSEPASEHELQRIDTLAGLAWSVVQLQPVVGYALQTQHLRLALRSGDPQRAAVALFLEAPLSANKGSRGGEQTRRALEAAREMGRRLDETQIPTGVVQTMEGIVALLEGRWLDGLHHLDNAERLPNRSPIGHSSMRGSIYAMRAMNLFWMGRSGDLLQQLPLQIRDMEDHSNLYGWLWLKLLEAWALSCSGRLEAAWAASELVRSRLPEGVFQLHRWYLEFGQVKFLLLEGKAEEAWQRLEQAERRTRFALLGQAQRVSGMWVRVNTALARGAENPDARRAMLAASRKIARRMENERVPWIDALARSVRASIAQLAGDGDQAMRLLAEAEPLLETHNLESVLAMARLHRGRALGGDAGRELVAHAEKWMAEQRVSPSVSRVILAGGWQA
jgi:hypothetical protein